MKKVMLLMVLFFSEFVFSQTVPFQLLPSGHIVVKAIINGLEGNFILDTGAGVNVYFKTFTEKFKSNPKSYNLFTGFRATGERLDLLLYRDQEILFAEKKFLNVPYATTDLSIPGIDGLLSLKMFENTDLLIDFLNKEITIGNITPTKYSKVIDIFISSQADDSIDIFTYATLNDKHKIKILLDTGAGKNSFWINEKFIEILAIDASALDISEKESETNKSLKTKIYRGKIASLSNDFSKLENPNIVFVQNLIYEGKTSLDWLGKKLFISVSNKKIYKLD